MISIINIFYYILFTVSIIFELKETFHFYAQIFEFSLLFSVFLQYSYNSPAKSSVFCILMDINGCNTGFTVLNWKIEKYY